MTHARPLLHRRIVVTRPHEPEDNLIAALREHGADVLSFPTIATVSVTDPILPKPGTPYDWAVFTSVHGVQYWFEALEKAGLAPSAFPVNAICAVGTATADALGARGIRVDLIPDKYVAESLVDALAEAEPTLSGKRFLLPRGDLARSAIPDALRAHGAVADEVLVYRTVCPDVPPERMDALMAFQPEAVVFTSSSTATNFCTLLGPAGLERLRKRTRFASIGPITTKTAQKRGLEVSIEPEQHDVPSLVDALAAAFGAGA